ncbi:MAG: Gfo/Idh/MocA family oxidoreductase [Negativicutes bacterium]|jgi:predicted dehydrogenase
MKFLVVGLGSMGKRRIRCLQALGFKEISGFDVREERRLEVSELGIVVYNEMATALAEANPSVLVISVPPDLHYIYIELAIKNNLHFFVEASVVDTNFDYIKQELLLNDTVVAAPSATLCFHPAILIIRKLISECKLGKISNIILHSGQFLPDWHTYENVSDYYVSNPATGGAREIVPFELTWLCSVFGFPLRVCGNCRKTIKIEGAEKIEDTYNCLLDYGDFLATVTVDVVSRHATRRLLINGDKGQLIWDWDYSLIRLFDALDQKWIEIPYEMKTAANGYNENIGENMYIEEMRSFIRAIEGKQAFINNMDNDHKVLKTLYAIEEADRTSRYIRIDQ